MDVSFVILKRYRAYFFGLLVLAVTLSTAAETPTQTRQRLLFIAEEQLKSTLDDRPQRMMEFSFPVSIPAENQSLTGQLNVLVEEGWLDRTQGVGSYEAKTGDRRVTRQGAINSYQITSKGRQFYVTELGFEFARSQFVAMDAIEMLEQVDGRWQARVHFSWRFKDVQPWLWAPPFDQLKHIRQLRRDDRPALSGTAILAWQNQGWRLINLDL